MAAVVVSKRGQVTIPRALREKLGIVPGQVLSLQETADGLLVERWDPDHDASDWMYHARFAPTDRPRGQVFASWEEFDAELARPDGVLVERWDPSHDAADWAYHARLAPKGPSGCEHLTAQDFLAALDAVSDDDSARP